MTREFQNAIGRVYFDGSFLSLAQLATKIVEIRDVLVSLKMK